MKLDFTQITNNIIPFNLMCPQLQAQRNQGQSNKSKIFFYIPNKSKGAKVFGAPTTPISVHSGRC